MLQRGVGQNVSTMICETEKIIQLLLKVVLQTIESQAVFNFSQDCTEPYENILFTWLYV